MGSGQSSPSLGVTNGQYKHDLVGHCKAYNSCDSPRHPPDPLPRTLAGLPNQVRLEVPLGKTKLSSTTSVSPVDLSDRKHTLAFGSENTKLKWSETWKREQTLGVEHRFDHQRGGHTFAESGMSNVQTGNGPSSGVFFKLGFSF